MKQPLLPGAVLYAGGILAGAMAPLSPWVLLGVCLGLGAAALGWGRGRAALLCPLMLLAGWTNLSLHTAVLSPNDLRRILGDQPAIVSVRGALRETPSLRAHQRGQKESWRAIAHVEATALTEEVPEPFIQAATYHIFAVDGLRMAIVFGIFFGLFRALGLPRPWSGAVLIPLIWFYVALTGWPASAIRATVMLSVVIVGWVLKPPSDLLNSLFVATLIIIIVGTPTATPFSPRKPGKSRVFSSLQANGPILTEI
jgi:hypothetical protein